MEIEENIARNYLKEIDAIGHHYTHHIRPYWKHPPEPYRVVGKAIPEAPIEPFSRVQGIFYFLNGFGEIQAARWIAEVEVKMKRHLRIPKFPPKNHIKPA